ncbi:hypothetical protein HPB51_002778 [Rhipicephalus microplus]|uniref:IMD domain-containing protein n=1 Tax=Rhipicephalus microplus TaxID=6941 RepID=A0A9J6D8H9_RHIMP|nr:hypothetical protein HPB51_002778 [Rhipicephalus microplus]
MEQLVIPLQDKLEDWKKSTLQLDKDHSKEFKRARQEIKKMSTDTLRLQKKVKKGSGKWEMQRSLECALQEMSDRCLLLEEAEKQAVRRALVEERARYCLLVACLTPVLEEELLMLQETSHLQEILDSLAKLTRNPECLPSASEQVITDLKASQGTWTFQFCFPLMFIVFYIDYHAAATCRRTTAAVKCVFARFWLHFTGYLVFEASIPSRDQYSCPENEHLLETWEAKLALEDLDQQRRLVARAKEAAKARGFLE